MDYDWRDETTKCVEYKKKFAWLPVACSDTSRIWLKFYYVKYYIYDRGGKSLTDYPYHSHTDVAEIMSEASYIMAKLTEGF